MPENDSLNELDTDAEQHREQFSEAQQRLREIKNKLRTIVDDLDDEGLLTPDEADRLHGLIDRGEYGEVREAIQRAREGHSATLGFDDEEKQQFADAFSHEWDELVAAVETIRTEIMRFDPYDRDQMVSLIYGKHSGMRKTDIRATLEAIDDVSDLSLSTDTAARVLAAFNSDLNITDAREVLEAIREEADDG